MCLNSTLVLFSRKHKLTLLSVINLVMVTAVVYVCYPVLTNPVIIGIDTLAIVLIKINDKLLFSREPLKFDFFV